MDKQINSISQTNKWNGNKKNQIAEQITLELVNINNWNEKFIQTLLDFGMIDSTIITAILSKAPIQKIHKKDVVLEITYNWVRSYLKKLSIERIVFDRIDPKDWKTNLWKQVEFRISQNRFRWFSKFNLRSDFFEWIHQ